MGRIPPSLSSSHLHLTLLPCLVPRLWSSPLKPAGLCCGGRECPSAPAGGRLRGQRSESKAGPGPGRRAGGQREEVMTLTIDPASIISMACRGPSPNLLEYIRLEIHNTAMFIQAQEETELNVKKQSGPAVGDDSS